MQQPHVPLDLQRLFVLSNTNAKATLALLTGSSLYYAFTNPLYNRKLVLRQTTITESRSYTDSIFHTKRYMSITPDGRQNGLMWICHERTLQVEIIYNWKQNRIYGINEEWTLEGEQMDRGFISDNPSVSWSKKWTPTIPPPPGTIYL